ncbi:BldC family transcriptional regulator [Streptosporangium saharense]|uniref:BldC family transcriptional regulator n=1 Tax=Streptosporangium saharense TaxID=1706840 RepID=UPI00367510B3
MTVNKNDTGPAERLLTPGEVAHIFGVDPKTVNRWSLTGKIPSLKTPGGQRRYRQSDIDALLGAPTGQPVRTSEAIAVGRSALEVTCSLR